MAAPNIVNVTTITGKTSCLDLSSTNATALVSNAASSGKVFKINTIIISNIDTVDNYLATVSFYSQDDIGGTAYAIISTVYVPARGSIVVIDKGSALYLEEDRSIGVTAGTANKLKVLCSYEEIS